MIWLHIKPIYHRFDWHDFLPSEHQTRPGGAYYRIPKAKWLHTYPLNPYRMLDTSCATFQVLFETPIIHDEIRIIDNFDASMTYMSIRNHSNQNVSMSYVTISDASIPLWLVVSTPLKNISLLGWLFPSHMENNPVMFQTINQITNHY